MKRGDSKGRPREPGVVVLGGAHTDYLVRSPRLPGPGQTVEGKGFASGTGGRGAHHALASVRLGARTAFVGRVGDDERGDAVVRQLAQEGVDTTYVERDPELPSGVALIVVDDEGEQQIATAPGANLQLSVEAIERAAPMIASAAVLLVELEVPLTSVLVAARVAKTGGAKVLLEPSPPRPLPDDLFPMLDLIRPSIREAEFYTGVRVKDRDSARAAAKVLLDRCVCAIAIEAGEEGHLLVWGEGECLLPKIAASRVYAGGAGDAFSAALAVAMSEGCTLTEAAPFVNRAAARATAPAVFVAPGRKEVSKQ